MEWTFGHSIMTNILIDIFGILSIHIVLNSLNWLSSINLACFLPNGWCCLHIWYFSLLSTKISTLLLIHISNYSRLEVVHKTWLTRWCRNLLGLQQWFLQGILPTFLYAKWALILDRYILRPYNLALSVVVFITEINTEFSLSNIHEVIILYPILVKLHLLLIWPFGYLVLECLPVF